MLRKPKQLNLIIALPMLLMLGGTSSWANLVELQPTKSQTQPFLNLETEDSTQTVPVEFSPRPIFYDRTPCKLYGKC